MPNPIVKSPETGLRSRKRRPWLGFVLNLTLTPAGYVYAGRPRLALIYIAALIAFGLLLAIWTIMAPPGVYFSLGGIKPPWTILYLIAWPCGLALAFHAMILCSRPPRVDWCGAKLWAIAVGAWLSPLILAFLVRAFLPLATYSIASASMSPTLSEGDIALARGARLACGRETIHAGEMIIYRKGAVSYVKRAIAHGGQTVALVKGVLVIDGVPAPQTLVGPSNLAKEDPGPIGTPRLYVETLANGAHYQIVKFAPEGQYEEMAPISVPTDAWFVLGDNRDNSWDSRLDGAVSVGRICGVVTKVLYKSHSDRFALRSFHAG